MTAIRGNPRRCVRSALRSGANNDEAETSGSRSRLVSTSSGERLWVDAPPRDEPSEGKVREVERDEGSFAAAKVRRILGGGFCASSRF